MKNFEYWNPTRVFFGRGETDRVGGECWKYGERVLVVYGGGSIKRNGLYDRVMDSLRKAGCRVFELSGIQPNPRIGKVREGVVMCRENRVDVVLAVGGGSVIDSAKIIAAGVCYEGDPWDFFVGKAPIGGRIPLGTVLTLAATGSEMNHNAVLSNDVTQEKRVVKDSKLFPDFSILDPENTFTVPREHTVYGIVDIMSHVFEQYFHRVSETSLQDYFAEGIMKTVIEYTPRVLANPHDYDARATIMWCGTMALNHLLEAGAEGDWATHRMGHELSALYDLAHGVVLAILFPQWMEYVLEVIPHKFARFAEQVWSIPRDGKDNVSLGRAGIRRTREWFKEIGAPVTLREVGVGEERLEEMAERATQRGPLGTVKLLSKEDVLSIYRQSL
ncbi:MAG: iron-containing alcohol dehydrogenase [Candidatus Caldatribacteriaceae bacterium]